MSEPEQGPPGTGLGAQPPSALTRLLRLCRGAGRVSAGLWGDWAESQSSLRIWGLLLPGQPPWAGAAPCGPGVLGTRDSMGHLSGGRLGTGSSGGWGGHALG